MPGSCRRLLALGIIVGLAILSVGCGGSASTSVVAASSGATNRVTASGTVIDRINGGPIDGATITFRNSLETRSATVVAGSYTIDVASGFNYDVHVSGPANVTHETQMLNVTGAGEFPFSVLKWGSGAFGATNDDTFQKFFHQLARVGPSSDPIALRKWVIPPTQLYVVEGTVPPEQLAAVLAVLGEINAESVSDLWCRTVAPLNIVTGPDINASPDGVIIVRPNRDTGSSGTIGPTSIRTGTVTCNMFRSGDNRLQTHQELKGILLHELFHVAFAYHVCGGDLGANPFGFSSTNCPYPDSLMANLGDLPVTLSPQDKLASCIVYHPDTHPGNLYQDVNPTYR